MSRDKVEIVDFDVVGETVMFSFDSIKRDAPSINVGVDEVLFDLESKESNKGSEFTVVLVVELIILDGLLRSNGEIVVFFALMEKFPVGFSGDK